MSNQPNSFLSSAGAGPAQYLAAGTEVAGNVNDLFDGLLEFQYRGIGFPIVETELDLRQDLVVHKFVDRDSGHVEATGRAPLQITARIPFLNGLAAGKQEHWVRPLYPTTWKRFFAACADRSSGTLQHPELGTLTVKCESARTRWSGDVRRGVFVNVTWIETDDDNAVGNLDLAAPSPLANAQAAASDLDAQTITVNPKIVPQPYVPPFGFSDLVRAIRQVVDIPTLMQKQFAGRVDNLIYEAQSLEDSLNRTTNASALNWPMIAAAERAKAACYDIKASQLNKGKPMGRYVVLKDSTLAQVAASIGAPVVDVMVLNPAYVQFPVIPKDAVVRFYLQAA